MPVRIPTLGLLVFALLALSATGAVAKPNYCDHQCYEPYYHGPSDPCTCPPGSFMFGYVTTCEEYFWGVCSGALSLPTPETLARCAAPLESADEAEAVQPAQVEEATARS